MSNVLHTPVLNAEFLPEFLTVNCAILDGIESGSNLGLSQFAEQYPTCPRTGQLIVAHHRAKYCSWHVQMAILCCDIVGEYI